ncbi:MAG TPA: hypothetical protein PLI79_00155 [Mycobacterium sp.]|nr:hypothetical protein [Mycobacterium sp.]
MQLVYWFADGSDGEYCVFFAPRERAEYVARICAALRDSQTWGDFKRRLPPGEWESYFQESFGESAEELDERFSDSDSFQADDVPGVADGFYPPSLAWEQTDFLPKDLIAEYGGESACQNLASDSAEDIADKLRALGHSVEEVDLDFDY